MKAILIALILATFAGCADDPPQNATVAPSVIAEDVNVTVSGLALAVDATNYVLQGTPLEISGTVSAASTITVSGGLEAVSLDVQAGAWNISNYPVDFGYSNLTITADDGASVASLDVLVQRQMLLTVAINHDAAQGQDRSDDIYWDFGGLRSLKEDESYQGCEQPHPGRPNAHDALLDYVDITGINVDFSDCGSFGVSPSNVDNVDYGPLGWCFTVNGEQADFGISLLELADGDVFEFVNCSGFA